MKIIHKITSHNSIVNIIKFINNDNLFITSSAQYNINIWKTYKWKKILEHYSKGDIYKCFEYDYILDILIVCN